MSKSISQNTLTDLGRILDKLPEKDKSKINNLYQQIENSEDSDQLKDVSGQILLNYADSLHKANNLANENETLQNAIGVAAIAAFGAGTFFYKTPFLSVLNIIGIIIIGALIATFSYIALEYLTENSDRWILTHKKEHIPIVAVALILLIIGLFHRSTFPYVYK